MRTKTLPTSGKENGFNLESAISSKSSLNCFLVAFENRWVVKWLLFIRRPESSKGFNDKRLTSFFFLPARKTFCISFAILVWILRTDGVAAVLLAIAVSHVWVTPLSHPQV